MFMYMRFFFLLVLNVLGWLTLIGMMPASFSRVVVVYAQTAQSVEQRQAALQAELDQTEKEIANWQAILKGKQAESASLQRDTDILNAKIQEQKLIIKARNLAIQQLGKDITTKAETIQTLDEQIAREQDSLSQLVRKTNELDSFSVVEMALSKQNLSDFFSDLDSFDSVSRSLNEVLDQVRGTKTQNEIEKQALSDKQAEEAFAKATIEEQKRQVEKNEAEKKQLLTISRTQEKTYAQVLADREKKAAQIRSALFALRDSAAIPFGTALKYANEVSAKTGVRPAFLLAIITQESALGENQGSCILSNIETGDGVGKNSGTFFEKIMAPVRDTIPFQSITSRLGRDWKITPVSCPPAAKYTANRGYGGGMGPAQFIPSTWELFKARIASALNISSPDFADPWNPEHAFMATGIYMQDLGAVASSFTAERNAACKYYSGASCRPGRKPANAFYGDQVMAKAQSIQQNMIDPLQNL